jgi:hypothetical protein
MTDSAHVWDEEEALVAPVREAHRADVIREKKKIEGRFVLYRNLCPLCGGYCPVRTSTRDGYPRIRCKKTGKFIECVYEDI